MRHIGSHGLTTAAWRRGAIVLPRPAARGGGTNWPWCGICKRKVDGYSLANETDYHVEVEAWCSGVRIDPATGQALFGEVRKHDPRKDSVRIVKAPGWTQARFRDIVSRLAFFAEMGERDYRQDLTEEGVRVK